MQAWIHSYATIRCMRDLVPFKFVAYNLFLVLGYASDDIIGPIL